jgi:hypothetical protein
MRAGLNNPNVFIRLDGGWCWMPATLVKAAIVGFCVVFNTTQSFYRQQH